MCRAEFPPELLTVDHSHAHCPTKQSCGECSRGLCCRQCNSYTIARWELHLAGDARYRDIDRFLWPEEIDAVRAYLADPPAHRVPLQKVQDSRPGEPLIAHFSAYNEGVSDVS